MHVGQARALRPHVPLDDAALAEREREGRAAVHAAIELVAVAQHAARVVRRDLRALAGHGADAGLQQDLLELAVARHVDDVADLVGVRLTEGAEDVDVGCGGPRLHHQSHEDKDGTRERRVQGHVVARSGSVGGARSRAGVAGGKVRVRGDRRPRRGEGTW